MDIRAYIPKKDFSLTTTKLIELHKYTDSKATTIKDEVVARVNAAMLMVFALGDVVVHAAVAVAKTAIAAVELPLYIAGTGADFNGTAAEVWCHTTHSIRSALTIFGSLAGLAKPEWTLHVYDWVALDVTAPKGLLAEAAQQVRQAVHNAWKSPHRNLVIGCAVTAAFVALGYVYLAPPKIPTDIGGSTPHSDNSGELPMSLIPLALGGLGTTCVTLWWAARRWQKNSRTVANPTHAKKETEESATTTPPLEKDKAISSSSSAPVLTETMNKNGGGDGETYTDVVQFVSPTVPNYVPVETASPKGPFSQGIASEVEVSEKQIDSDADTDEDLSDGENVSQNDCKSHTPPASPRVPTSPEIAFTNPTDLDPIVATRPDSQPIEGLPPQNYVPPLILAPSLQPSQPDLVFNRHNRPSLLTQITSDSPVKPLPRTASAGKLGSRPSNTSNSLRGRRNSWPNGEVSSVGQSSPLALPILHFDRTTSNNTIAPLASAVGSRTPSPRSSDKYTLTGLLDDSSEGEGVKIRFSIHQHQGQLGESTPELASGSNPFSLGSLPEVILIKPVVETDVTNNLTALPTSRTSSPTRSEHGDIRMTSPVFQASPNLSATTPASPPLLALPESTFTAPTGKPVSPILGPGLGSVICSQPIDLFLSEQLPDSAFPLLNPWSSNQPSGSHVPLQPPTLSPPKLPVATNGGQLRPYVGNLDPFSTLEVVLDKSLSKSFKPIDSGKPPMPTQRSSSTLATRRSATPTQGSSGKSATRKSATRKQRPSSTSATPTPRPSSTSATPKGRSSVRSATPTPRPSSTSATRKQRPSSRSVWQARSQQGFSLISSPTPSTSTPSGTPTPTKKKSADPTTDKK